MSRFVVALLFYLFNGRKIFMSDRKKNLDDNEVDYKKKITARHKRNKIFGIILLVCLSSVIIGMTLGVGFGFASRLFDKFMQGTTKNNFVFDESQIKNELNQNSAPSNIFSSESENLQDIIENVSKSVVAINTTTESINDDIFSRFIFGDGTPYQQKGSGSGIIFYKDNEKIYISTNSHVISGANSVEIIIDSKPIKAKFLGKNVLADLAVIYLEKKDLEENGLNIENINTAKFGDSDNIRIGEKIIAIGNAMGEGNSATEGIISVKNKEITVDGRTLNMIQVDAPINPGNSGGALINTKGEVIGVTTAKYARFTVEGMSYCIPSNTAKSVIENIMQEPNKPYLGIRGIDITDELANNYGLPRIGVIIAYIEKDSVAQKYGLQINDVITMVDGKSVNNIQELSNYLNEHKIGDEIKLHLMRRVSGFYRGIDLNIKLEERENIGF